MDLPTYVSLIAEQSQTKARTRTSVGPSEVPNLEEAEEKQGSLAEHHHLDSSRPEGKEDVPGDSRTSGNHGDESATVVPLGGCVIEGKEEVPLLSLPAACLHPLTSPLFCDPQRENGRRGCLPASKLMKRSSSLISDSGIESEPSSVAWPLDAGLRGPPPQDFSSQQAERLHPAHRSSLEGLQMESNGSLPSAGIQASLTSISSLPYEEEQQQRQLSKLTKSASAPQISSPEDTEDEHVLLDPEHHQDPASTSCEAPSGAASRSEAFTSRSEGPLLPESPESPCVTEGAVLRHQGENGSPVSPTSGTSPPAEASPRSRGNHPCVQEDSAAEAGDECFHQPESEEQSSLQSSHNPLGPPAVEGPPTGRLLDDAPPAEPGGIPAALDCQAKATKTPHSGLAFVNKKMVEMVNMSVSCAPTCLPFSSVLRDSPSISGMSPRQATSPITHQPLGSFGIVSSSSLSQLTLEDSTNERMLK